MPGRHYPDGVPAPDVRPRAVELLAFVVGAASLGAEIAAARLLAPWFGASTVVWANTIATVLCALSAGYWLGGRTADRDPTVRGLARLVLVASGLLALVPFVSGPFLRASVDALDEVSAGAFLGSLIGVSALIAVPVLLLGMVSPYALRLTVHSVEEAGRVAGRLYAISTLGSLAGVFAAALVLVPFAGTRRTFLVFAGLLALAAVVVARQRIGMVAVPALLAALLALPTGTLKTAGGDRVVWERETAYQYARVVQDDDGTRRLELNEGQAVHSVYRPGRFLTGDYWDEPLVLPFAAGGRAPRSIAILGGAAGTIARSYGRFHPQARVDLVEIDGALLDVGRELFDLRGPDLHLHREDARPFLRATDRRWDVIYVDAYRQPYIPFYLATREFFALARERLNPGGSVIVNVGHPEGSKDLERVLTATMRAELPTVLRDPSEPTNTQLVATTNADAGGHRVRAAVARGEVAAPLAGTAMEAAGRLEPGLRGGRVYTDDVAPVEWLIDSSIVQVAADGEA